jgi:hypothetical protein
MTACVVEARAVTRSARCDSNAVPQIAARPVFELPLLRLGSSVPMRPSNEREELIER